MSSPRPGTVTTTTESTRAHHVHLVLADAHGLDQHPVEAGGVEQVDRVARGAGEAAHGAAGGHRADEDAGVGVEGLHADAVAQEGAAGERAGGIDGEDADRLARACRQSRARRSTSVLLPAPGGPVIPTTRALPVSA